MPPVWLTLSLSVSLLVASCAPTPEPPAAPPDAPPPPLPALEPERAKEPAVTAPLEVAEPPKPVSPDAHDQPVPDAPPAMPTPAAAHFALGPVPPLPTFNAAIKAKPTRTVAPSPDDPLGGKFSLADATRGMPPKGTLVADIETTFGVLTCRLLASQAPRNVANFVGLARGLRPFRDPRSNTWITRPAYDGTTFHRVIPNFMIQGGDPSGTGSGEPGYVIPDEVWAGGAHDRPGLLCAANRGPDTNGMQFFITDGAAAHIDNGFTIFGVCGPVETVHQIAMIPKDQRDRPQFPAVMNSVKIRRVPGP